ncbi:ABC transporter permease [Natronococcus jeotgali]|uniref:Binding-protein-dependent transport systems inner membrane component n=1 Tax=Natronococcus jeotgali DSM 18795 TaxID=1227498 RepID=L9X6Y6_9EURY|nr:ABC transporter permease [Natronococcus jeotgali]ELY57211.1 binding-protein-dependent transport systems inner membrane component [Natronococcus jeotgali DSM 18795]
MIDERAERRDGCGLEGVPEGRDGLERSRSIARGVAVRLLPPSIVLAALLAAWHGFVLARDVPTIVLPSPAAVGAALAETYPTLLADAAVTAATAGIGLVAGAVVGAGLAFAMVRSRTAAETVLPYVVALRIAPVIAIAPLLFLWFGRGIPARSLVVATLTVFPITIATLDGLRGTPEPYLELARTVDASPTAVFVRIRVPAAAPSVFAGLKIAATLSVVGAVVAEFVALTAGLGYRVFETAAYLRTAETYAALVVLSLVGIAFYLVPVALERLLWQ